MLVIKLHPAASPPTNPVLTTPSTPVRLPKRSRPPPESPQALPSASEPRTQTGSRPPPESPQALPSATEPRTQTGSRPPPESPQALPSASKTRSQLDSVERDFLKHYDIHKVYCRYFDVVMRDNEPMPNATIAFRDTVDTSLDIVPTVYITEDCMHRQHNGLAENIVQRIIQMNQTNDVHHVKEIQMDCDYTARSLKTYYQFLQDVRTSARQHHIRLSTTIRLHQLSMPVPPADYGVLMLYNTGNPQNYAERNPILDIRDVMPYISHLDDYPLPLAAAYPVFLWQRTVYGVHVDHWVHADEILKVKHAVEAKRPELRRTILTYHLDEQNINRYKPQIYEAIYHH